ncbi:MAG TPA: UDP-glucose 4-epimerase GalE [Planctomycetota bacterium]|nr:UDP-glucose 4-epimerase GalE [Planctomycetota bacterium]
MRVLVTGGAGYIGSHTARDLARAGHDVVILDDLSTGHPEAIGDLPLARLDLAAGDVAGFIAEGKFDAVIHFAAKCLVPESVAKPALYWRTNAMGMMRLLDALAQHGPRRIVFSSTCATYGLPLRSPIDEDHPQKPITSYGRTKLACEHALDDYARAYGIGSISLRYFNAAGAAEDGGIGEDHEHETHLIPLMLRAVVTGEPLRVTGTDYDTPDGTCIRDYVHVMDLAAAHRIALEKIEPGKAQFFNIGTGKGHSVREVISTGERVTGRKVPTVEAPRRPGDPPALVAKTDLARSTLGFAPKFTLEDIVRTAWRWHERHPKGYGRGEGT